MDEVFNYIDSNKEKFLKELIEFLKIRSISSLPDYSNDVKVAAEYVVEALKNAGIEKVELIPTKGHPIIYAENLDAGPDLPTVLIYGHYDVQPVDPIEKWKIDPFEPTVQNGNIYARGASDDKGQLYVHIKAIEAIMKNDGKLPVNVKFLIEGEEEAGSSNLDRFIYDKSHMLACDAALVSDTEWFAEGYPSICYSLRGIAYFEMTVQGANEDLHSGTYGGAVDNPLNVLCWMIAAMKDRYGRLTIPGFYDNVVDLHDDERAGFAKLPFDENEYKERLGLKETDGEFGYTTLERVWARPSFDLNGIYGGYTGEGAKTVLPTSATAKFSMRLVPHQKAEEISIKTINYLHKIAPPTVKVTVKSLHGGDPVLVPRDGAGIKACKTAFKKAFGKEPVFMREGGSIPVVGLFQEVLHAPTVLMGLGLPDDNIHAPNEKLNLENFYGGIKASAAFLYDFPKFA